jgi:pimeloyl-ACP methyl ester carboxylesterase
MKIIAYTLGAALLAALGGWLYLRAPDIPAEELTAQYGRDNSRYADLSQGVRLHYLESGPADAPAVLLIHGFGDNSFSWDGWTKALTPAHRVIAVDLPGHGLTQSPADFIAAADKYANILDELRAKLGITRWAVAGNSMGGSVAWQSALRHADHVSHLILVAAGGWPSKAKDENPPLAFRLMKYKLGRDFITSIDNKPLILEGLKRNVVDDDVLTDALIQRWADLQRLPGHRPILMSMNPASAVASAEKLAAISIPTLILWGQQDPLLDVSGAHHFKAAIPQAELIIYPDIGHLPQWEQPDRTGQDAAKFLAQHIEPQKTR